MIRRRPLLLPAALALIAPFFGACPSRSRAPAADPGETVLAGPDDRPYRTGTPSQRQAIDGLVAGMGSASGEAFLELGRRIVAHGEYAVPPLLGALGSEDPLVRERAAYLLGVIKDRRTVPTLYDVAAGDPVPRVRYEAAGALLEVRDARGLDILVAGLEDPDARLRAKCADVLKERTGNDLGFEADAPLADREAAVRRWRAWLAQRAKEAAGIRPPDPQLPEAPPSRGR